MSVFQWVKLGVNPQSYIMPILGGLTAIGIAPTAKEYFNSAKEYGSYAGRMACDLTNQATGYFSSGIPSIPCESFFPSESTKESANFNAENPSFETSEGASATFSDNLADATVKIVGAFTEGLAKGSTKVFMQTAETVIKTAKAEATIQLTQAKEYVEQNTFYQPVDNTKPSDDIFDLGINKASHFVTEHQTAITLATAGSLAIVGTAFGIKAYQNLTDKSASWKAKVIPTITAVTSLAVATYLCTYSIFQQ